MKTRSTERVGQSQLIRGLDNPMFHKKNVSKISEARNDPLHIPYDTPKQQYSTKKIDTYA